jgi:hypothetical protein
MSNTNSNKWPFQAIQNLLVDPTPMRDLTWRMGRKSYLVKNALESLPFVFSIIRTFLHIIFGSFQVNLSIPEKGFIIVI